MAPFPCIATNTNPPLGGGAKYEYKGHISRFGHVFRLGHLFVKIRVQRPPFYWLGHLFHDHTRPPYKLGHLLRNRTTLATFLLTWPPFAKIAQHWPPFLLLTWPPFVKSNNIGHHSTDLATFRKNRTTLATFLLTWPPFVKSKNIGHLFTDLATFRENRTTLATFLLTWPPFAKIRVQRPLFQAWPPFAKIMIQRPSFQTWPPTKNRTTLATFSGLATFCTNHTKATS